MPHYWSDGSDTVRGKTAEKLNQQRRDLKRTTDAPPPTNEEPSPPKKAPSMWGTRVTGMLHVKTTPCATGGVEEFM